MKKYYILLLILAITSFSAIAQRQLGIANGNWSGMNSIFLNPASIADSRSKFTIDIFSLNGFVNNDLGKISKKRLFDKIANGGTPGVNDILNFNQKPIVSVMAPYVEFRGPGFMWNIDHVSTIAFTTRIRVANQFADIDQTLYRTILDPDYAQNGNGDYKLSSHNFRWNSAAWSELGLTYARVLKDDGENFLAGGATVRYLGGISHNSLVGRYLDATYTSSGDSLRLDNTDLMYSSNVMNDESITTGSDLFGRFLGGKGGKGVSADIGMTYELRPTYDKFDYDMDGEKNIPDYGVPRYTVRLSASITDIGAINFGKRNNRRVEVSGSGYTIGNGLSKNVSNYNDFRKYMKGHGFTVDTAKENTVYYMPAALVLGGDFRLGSSSFYMNATFITNLAKRMQIGNYYYNQLTVAPRYDTRTFSAALPVTFDVKANALKLGTAIRVSSFYIGSDDMMALFNDNQYGFNFYMGAFIPLNFRRPSDRDNDRVSDKRDRCPDVPGLLELAGCPDPDRDKDGIPDSVDKCPMVYGHWSAKGCPDRDRDSIADATDRCPGEGGPLALKGCPDRDGDGIPDIDDACPDAKGTEALKGCPDKDGDGVGDDNDKCPDVPGFARYSGCPDTDGDGVPDNIDKCPDTPGTTANNGCPEIKANTQLKKNATAFAFETGKAVIATSSYASLNEVVVLLKQYPEYYMTIEGHTDNVGSEESNQVLSLQRAEAVKTYFIKKGIAADRLQTSGAGESAPIADNNTANGKAQNRRVEMRLKKK